MRWIKFLSIFLLALLSANVFPSPTTTHVDVGVFVNRVYNLSLRDGNYNVDFYIWFRWKGDNVNPIETFEISNGKIENKTIVESKKVKGENYTCARVNALIFQQFDTINFPFDQHRLKIQIEDGDHEIESLKYSSDLENSKVASSVSFAGYEIKGSSGKLKETIYNTNFGDPELPKDNEVHYSQFEFNIHIHRTGFGYFLKLYWGIYLSAAVALLSLFIKPTDLDPRFGMGVGALFAIMANIFVVSNELPDNGQMTTADHLNMLSISIVCLSLLISTISLKLYSRDKVKASEKLDIWSVSTLTAGYVALSLKIIIDSH